MEREQHMRGKLLFAAGLAVGYVVGARAGRPAYDALVERVRGGVENPKVQEVAAKAKETLEQKAPQVAAVAEQAAATASGVADAARTAAEDPSTGDATDAPDAGQASPERATPKPPASGGTTSRSKRSAATDDSAA
jgi:hypothetical protein